MLTFSSPVGTASEVNYTKNKTQYHPNSIQKERLFQSGACFVSLLIIPQTSTLILYAGNQIYKITNFFVVQMIYTDS